MNPSGPPATPPHFSHSTLCHPPPTCHPVLPLHPKGEQPPATEEPHDYVQEAGSEEEATQAAPPFTQPSWDSEPGWDADGPAAPQSYTQPSWDEVEGGQGAPTGWGEDEPQAVQSEGGWGDDGGAQVGLGEEDAATGWAVEGQTGWANAEGQTQWEPIADGELASVSRRGETT